MLKNNRPTRTDNLAAFNELRRVFAEISDKYTNQKLNSSIRSSFGVNRVKFKSQIESKENEKLASRKNQEYAHQSNQQHQYNHFHQQQSHNQVNKIVQPRKRNDSKSQIEER